MPPCDWICITGSKKVWHRDVRRSDLPPHTCLETFQERLAPVVSPEEDDRSASKPDKSRQCWIHLDVRLTVSTPSEVTAARCQRILIFKVEVRNRDQLVAAHPNASAWAPQITGHWKELFAPQWKPWVSCEYEVRNEDYKRTRTHGMGTKAELWSVVQDAARRTENWVQLVSIANAARAAHANARLQPRPRALPAPFVPPSLSAPPH